jgi:hypothetical protein
MGHYREEASYGDNEDNEDSPRTLFKFQIRTRLLLNGRNLHLSFSHLLGVGSS